MSVPFPGFTATPVSSASTMTSDLSPDDFKYNNGKILKELDKLKNQNSSAVIRGFDGKNYKVPEWLAPEKLDIEMAERLIEYKKKMSTQWCEAKTTTKAESESESEEEAETPKLEIKKNKKSK